MTPPDAGEAPSLMAHFLDQVARAPDAIAFVTLDGTATYDEFARRVGAVSTALEDREVPVGSRVAVLLGLGLDGVAATLGVLAAGHVAAPLSHTDPARRIDKHRRLVDPAAVIVADDSGRSRAEAAGFETDQIITMPSAPGRLPTAPKADAAALALLITTSGSTGQPKAVMHSSRSLLDNARRYRDGLGITAADRIAWHSPLSGGQGIVAMTTALTTGATLCPYPLSERGAAGFSAWLNDAGITVIDTLPSVMRHLASTLDAADVARIRVVRIASEPAYRADYATFRQTFPPSSRLVHVLASAETGIIAQHECSAADVAAEPGRLPVGLAAPGITVTLLDGEGDEVSDGAVGQLLVSAADIALGYWRSDPEQAAKFTADADRRRSFHSSDLAVMTTDGLVMQGRSDLQVKVRGHRVQVDEVEAVLLRHPAVAGAGVVPITTANGDTRLVARVVARPGHTIDLAVLRAAAMTALPTYAVPAELGLADSLPTTATAKLDRAELDRLVTADLQTQVTPTGVTTSAGDWSTADHIAAIWARALGVPAVEHTTGFLQLGGDSLLAAVIGALVDDQFDVALPMAYFRSDPTVEEMAARVDAGAEDDSSAHRRLGRAAAGARDLPSYTQQAMLNATSSAERATQVNVAVPYIINGDLDPEALARTIGIVVARHEILHTTFSGDPMRCRIRPPASALVESIDLCDEAEPLDTALARLRAQAEQIFDLASGPLLRFDLLRVADRSWRLHRYNHHVIADNHSWQIFFEEVADRYTAEVGGAVDLTEPPLIQYADFAAWERATFGTDSAELDAEVDWWAAALEDFNGRQLNRALRRGNRSTASGQQVLHWGIPTDVGQSLDEIGRELGATYFDSRLATVTALIGTTFGISDLPVWTHMTSRTSATTLRMIGPMVDQVWLPLRFDAERSGREWMREVSRLVTSVAEHSAIPRSVVQAKLRDRGVAPGPWPLLFQSDPAPTQLLLGDATLRALPRRHVNPSGVEIGVTQHGEDSECSARFNPHVIDGPAVAALVGQLADFSARIAAEPDTAIGELLG